MKRLLLGFVAAVTSLTAAGSAEAQRWHHRGYYGGGYHHGWHRVYGSRPHHWRERHYDRNHGRYRR